MTEQIHPTFPPRKFIGVAVLLLVGALIMGAAFSGIRAEAAWSQGYAMGLMAGGDGGDALTQYLLYNGGALGRSGHGPGGFFGVLLLIFGFIAVAKIGRMWMWRMHGGPEAWRHGWHHHDGPVTEAPSPAEATAAQKPATPSSANPPAPADDVTQM